MFKIKVVQWVQQNIIISFNLKNIFQYFIYLKLILGNL